MKDFCDNTDCTNSIYKPKVYLVQLIKDFGHNVVSWCAKCIEMDKDMIDITEREYKNDYP